MNFSSTFLTFLSCFLYFASTLSAPLEETVLQRLNRELQSNSRYKYTNYFQSTALVAASAGRNVFKMPESLSEDCVKTTKVTMRLLATPSAWTKAQLVLQTSVLNAVDEIKSGKPFANPMELFCQQLNEQFTKIHDPDFPSFEELKKNTDLPKPTKNYYLEMQPNKSIEEILTPAEGTYDYPEIYKLSAMMHFQVFENLTIKQYKEFSGIAKAIRLLSEHKTLRTATDDVFYQAFEDYCKEIQTKYADNQNGLLTDAMGPSLLKKVDEYFSKNAALKEEYLKLKTETIDEINKNGQKDFNKSHSHSHSHSNVPIPK